jgi:polyisoprenyl-teichoic acid--peptidoglycan teichoic acid transferase
LINALLEEEIDYIFLPKHYSLLFKSIEGLEDIDLKTKVIYSSSKEVLKDINTNVSIDKPFTILLMGVDSEKDGIKDSAFNGDSLILLTFNPETFNTTILSIPRDTYVPIACFKGQRENKITHAAWFGQDCMIETIENLMDIKIDYFVKLNFKGLVSIVDALGGITVDVPYNFVSLTQIADGVTILYMF